MNHLIHVLGMAFLYVYDVCVCDSVCMSPTTGQMSENSLRCGYLLLTCKSQDLL